MIIGFILILLLGLGYILIQIFYVLKIMARDIKNIKDIRTITFGTTNKPVPREGMTLKEGLYPNKKG